MDTPDRLYEQERGKQDGFPRLGEYMRRWSGWVRAGLPTGEIIGNSGRVVGVFTPVFCGLVGLRGLGGGGFVDGEVQEFHG